tara:strand:+ start:43 stop:168 length:126 start_codon:yes stop_codon:yes gene_type:complete
VVAVEIQLMHHQDLDHPLQQKLVVDLVVAVEDLLVVEPLQV